MDDESLLTADAEPLHDVDDAHDPRMSWEARTMRVRPYAAAAFIAFLAEGIGIYALLSFATNPLLFVVLSGLVFFAWGEIYSLFPATCTDIYGRKFATTNYGMLYTAKGTAALMVPLGNVLMTATGSWTAVFVIAAALNIIAAIMALTVLRPLRLLEMVKG